MKQTKKVTFITRLYFPHVGGVEKQVAGLSRELINRGFDITLITEKYNNELKDTEKVDGVQVLRLSYPKIPVIGLLVIWIRMFKYLSIFSSSELIHAFGSFNWIWPIRVILFRKRYYVTFYGWEGKYPMPLQNKVYRKIANLFTKRSMADAGFIEKYYGIKANVLRYASFDQPPSLVGLKNKKRKVVYVGRLDRDTGLERILDGLGLINGRVNVEFCGDGELFEECKKYGKVNGFVNPKKFYTESLICLSPGHTSIIEAFFYKCLVITTYDNPLKRDYLLMTPFKDWIVVEKDPKKLAEKIQYYLDHPEKAKPMIDAAYEWVQGQTWEKMADTYEELWGVKKSKV